MRRVLVFHSSTGIGDLVTTACAVAGLVHACPETHVTLSVPRRLFKWAQLFRDAHVVTSNTFRDRSGFEHVFEPYQAYEAIELPARGTKDRHHCFAEVCGVVPRLPSIGLSDKVTAHVRKRSIALKKPMIALAPLANSGSRTWPMHHWIELEDMILTNGLESLIMADPRDKILPRLMKGRISKSSPAATAAKLRQCTCLIGNDSGMAHLAGALGVKTLVVCGPTSGESIFSFYPTVNVLQAQFPCSPCYWDMSSGYRRACEQICEALWTVRPREVFDWIMQVV